MRTIIPLSVRPHDFYASPTVTASATSEHAGIVIYGFFKAQYLLPDGDYLLMIANHNNDATQLLYITHDAEKLRALPGKRCASIVANAISQLNRYRIRSDNYSKPRTETQLAKYELTLSAIGRLEGLLEQERELAIEDWDAQERLRREVLSILCECEDGNRLLSNNPVISEGELGKILYEARQSAQHYQFNRVYPVSRIDQLDFTKEPTKIPDKRPFYVWDSEPHIGNDETDLYNTLRVICRLYELKLGSKLAGIPANRFERLGLFFKNIWLNSRQFIDYWSLPLKPSQPSQTTNLYTGLATTEIKPYYALDGVPQKGYSEEEISEADHIKFFEQDGLYYPLPSGDDLVSISELSGKHLYLDQRIKLQFKAFFSKLPSFFVYVYRSITEFITHDLYDDFINHIHRDHPEAEARKPKVVFKKRTSLQKYLMSLQEILQSEEGLLANGQTLEQFIHTQISNSNYVLVREEHPPSPPTYDNPLHRLLEVTRHIGAYFVDLSEKNPIIGTLALAAYAYGGGAIVAPETLTALLTKLQLKGLIAGIKPTQAFAQWMSHGTSAEAISVAATYWQGIVVGGDLDKFFIEAVKILKDNPAEVAIITALAVTLGFGLCEAIPALQEEMGQFPYVNYAFLGLKGGIAINDTIMHPGNDWLLGSIKWLLRGSLILIKFLIAPFFEGYYYGGDGFVSGLEKSIYLLIRTVTQSIAALLDLTLALLTMPFLEISSMFIHVPFRGITNFLAKTLATLGNWQVLGETILNFSPDSLVRNYFSDFRLSPLYGFSSPFGRYVENSFLNIFLNGLMLFISPPLQLLKNFIVLPAIDLISLMTRASLTLMHPVIKVVAFSVGTFLKTSGFLWDNSCGLLFQWAAKGLTLGANWIDHQAGRFKQFTLSKIQICRLSIYNWAFDDEDLSLHKVNDDHNYLKAHPINVEKLPHGHNEKKKCLMDLLLRDKLEAVTQPRQETGINYPPLFSPREEERKHQKDSSQERVYSNGFI
ncbi:coiled-coil protein [Legionella nautarum]|uniref:Coiled-coil protein n=2 Tax=Legionella nautarum TaxID=45070 RepID=A0A0W0X422_9GAMM|nr:coiled-coil protein [Legionella nautarum]